MQTLSDVIRRLRSLLDEPAPPTSTYGAQRLYRDTELTDWINDGCRDIARRTEDLANINTSIAVIAGTGAYTLPTDTIRITRVDFQPTASTQVYPIEIRQRNEIDQLIGFNPTIQSSYPWVCWMWGTPNNVTFPLTIYFYPVFSTGGTLSVWYYRMPTRINDPLNDPSQYSALVETVEGWEDLIIMYALTRALQKARNPEWTQRKQEYEDQVTAMIEVTRQWHNQPNRMLGSRERWSMDWLYGFEVS